MPQQLESLWSRRQVVQSLSGFAGLPLAASGKPPLRHVGIIGGGMAGVSLAWLLDGYRSVTIFEAQESIGGNVDTVAVELDGQTFPVDLGAQYFHPKAYPTYSKLLFLLGLLKDVHSFNTSITVYAGNEPATRFISPLLPGRVWPILAPWNTAGLQAFSTAFKSAQQREQANASWNLNVEDWLSTLGLPEQQWESTILPWIASLESGVIEQARSLSARAAMIFAAKTLPSDPLAPLPYYVLNRGMVEVLNQMLTQCTTVDVRTGAPAISIQREPRGGFRIWSSGYNALVDDLVFACSGPPTLQLISQLQGTYAQQAALQGIEFFDTSLVLHTDPIYAPANQSNWSFLNCQVEGAYCEASMWLADVLAMPQPATAAKLWKSWAKYRSKQPSNILHETRFKHMLPTVATLAAQNTLLSLQGSGDIWFAGGYTQPYDSQESALRSALSVVQGLAVESIRAAALG